MQTRDVRWTNYRDRTTLGDEVPNVITAVNLVPAGTHRGRAIVDELISCKRDFAEISDVVWDPGYSLCQPETTAFAARSGRHRADAAACHPSARDPALCRRSPAP